MQYCVVIKIKHVSAYFAKLVVFLRKAIYKFVKMLKFLSREYSSNKVFPTFKRAKVAFFVLLAASILITYLMCSLVSSQSQPVRSGPCNHCGLPLQPEKYLINTSACKIPDIGAFGEEVMPFYNPIEPINCGDVPTYTERQEDHYVLYVNESRMSTYSMLPVSCCVSKISRRKLRNRFSDTMIKYSDCKKFDGSIQIYDDFVKLSCSTLISTVYTNVYAFLQQSTPIRNKIERRKREESARNETFSVTMIGLDSVSNFNLIRSLPETYNFLQEANFITMKGYNKIEDNTYPNLLAILTGKTFQRVYQLCDPSQNPMVNDYLIWSNFSRSGYVTAYAEDWSLFSTFNYGRTGFNETPTDYYFRPYYLAVDQLSTTTVEKVIICNGPQVTTDRMLTVARDFVEVFRDVPTFSLFWMASAAHENINGGSMVDKNIMAHLQKMVESGAVRNTFLIFLSDHGFRFGEVRNSYSGWLEERLPFIYFLVPEKFKGLYPEKYGHFLANTEKLTTPFDLYMTLQEILSLSDKNYKVEPSNACPKCRSLFSEIPEDRTCPDAAILSHWCTCTQYKHIEVDHPLVKGASSFAVEAVNALVGNLSRRGEHCAKFEYKGTISASIADYADQSNNKTDGGMKYLTMMFVTAPNAEFEVTVVVTYEAGQPRFRIEGDISRIDRYGPTSSCVSDPVLQKYCYCVTLSHYMKIFGNKLR